MVVGVRTRPRQQEELAVDTAAGRLMHVRGSVHDTAPRECYNYNIVRHKVHHRRLLSLDTGRILQWSRGHGDTSTYASRTVDIVWMIRGVGKEEDVVWVRRPASSAGMVLLCFV